jgi:hypothetical protein
MSEGNEEFRRGLLEQNGCCDPDSPLMKSLLGEEKKKLRLIRNICIAAWVVFMTIMVAMFGVALIWFLVGMGPGEETVALLPLVLLSSLVFLGFTAAVAASLVLYFRSRTVSLSGIEARLAALEQMLAAERGGDAGMR